MERNEDRPRDCSPAPGNHRVSMRVILIALGFAALIPLQFNAAHAKGALAKPPDAQLTLVSSVDFRDIMGEVLTKHLGNTDLDFLLPGHTFVALDMFETA